MCERVGELRSRRGRAVLKAEWKPIRHEWCLGDESFKEYLQQYLEAGIEGKQRSSYSGEAIKHHDTVEAERLVLSGMKALGLRESSLKKLAKGEMNKCLLAWLVHTHTGVSHKWIAERLSMGHGANMTAYIRRGREDQSSGTQRLKQRLRRVVPK